jgi:uncharacterized protein
MKLKEKYGSVALVAGASEGLGAAYARALAREGFELILLARREEQLQKMALEIQDKYRVKVTCIRCDLSEPNATDQVLLSVGSIEVDFFVYNAALPFIGSFLNFPPPCQVSMTATNMVTPLKLVHHFGNKMVAKGRGGMVLMTSLAAFQGSPFITTYAATKAFLLTLAEGLWFEWKSKGVDVIGCCAGATATPNYINSRPARLGWFRPQVQSPEVVVTECLKKIGKAPSIITGRSNRIASFFMRKIFSRTMAVNTMGRATKKMYSIDY